MSTLGALWTRFALASDWRQLDDRALCRRLTLEGFENFHAARAAAGSILWFSGARGDPNLAERVLRLYGGDPQARLTVLPEPPSESVPAAPNATTFIEVPFGSGSVACSLRLAEEALRQGAALLPIFGGRARRASPSAFRVEIGDALLPLGTDAADLTRRALARIDAQAQRILGRD